ncbi:inorganic triphosphatase [Ferrigenium kumadai]|uniref:Inorganic triphosphatase n=1 Tax=Ferrigenium kumadai TaxID=1682490 RepID=A0AAN1SZZ2_9PROT|nr:CYTH and CHAD domain-containing protein [Ferrigenium kumadai]BBI99751.1 inorganic triphosphatase [Ferrigenium kumadai]
MAVETELKLSISPEHLNRLKRHPLLRRLSVSRAANHKLYSVYFDTPALDLRNHAMALRLRRAGKQWLQTLKGGGGVQAGLHQRNEWETPVAGEGLDFEALKAAGGELPRGVRKELQPVFVTDFSRNLRLLKFEGAEIELCMDKGEVRTEQHSFPICELELELKSGEPRQLFELALALLDIVPFELETVSKAEQGYRLLSGDTDGPVKGGVPQLGKADKLAQVLQTLIWSCLQHLQGNLRGAMHGDDAEYLHQMRVALRRLRVVLRLAAKVRPDSELASLSSDVAKLCIALGRIREWDVFIADTVQPMCARMPGHGGLQALLAASEERGAACYEALRCEAQARELQRLILRFAIWMDGPYWQQDGDQLRACDFATRHLRKLFRRFDQAGQQLNGLEAERLHALRILAKKLRYSAEFFAGLYGKQQAKSFLAALSEVQDVLGQINDVAVAHRLLDELAEAPALSAHQEAIGLAQGWIAHNLSHQYVALRKAIQRFRKQSAFWDK